MMSSRAISVADLILHRSAVVSPSLPGAAVSRHVGICHSSWVVLAFARYLEALLSSSLLVAFRHDIVF